MSDHIIDPTGSPRVQETLVLVHNWEEEFGREKDLRSQETGRRYSDDGKRVLVDLHGVADHAGVVVKAPMPTGIGEHDIGSAVRAMLIGRLKEPAKIRLNAQGVEVVPTDSISPDAR